MAFLMQPITKPLGILPTTTFEGIKQSKTRIRFSTLNKEHIFYFSITQLLTPLTLLTTLQTHYALFFTQLLTYLRDFSNYNF